MRSSSRVNTRSTFGSPRPSCSVLGTTTPTERSLNANVSGWTPTIYSPAPGYQDRLICPGTPQCYIRRAEGNSTGKRIGPWIQKYCLSARARSDGAVELSQPDTLCEACKLPHSAQRRADRRARWNATSDARRTPVNSAAGINDSGPLLRANGERRHGK